MLKYNNNNKYFVKAFDYIMEKGYPFMVDHFANHCRKYRQTKPYEYCEEI